MRVSSRKGALCVGLPLAAVCAWLSASAAVAWVTTTRKRPPAPEALPVGRDGWESVESVRLLTSDGQQLGAWYAPGTPGRAAAILLHGNGGSRSRQVGLMSVLMEEGYGCLAVTLRAHGDSTGAENDFGWSSRYDALAAAAFVESRRPGEALVFVGTSMGAVASIFAAAELGPRVTGYLLEAPYRDLISAVEDRTTHYLPPGLDRLAFVGLRLCGPLFLEADPEVIRPIDYVGLISPEASAIFLAAGADPMAPPGDVRELERLCSANSRLEVFADVGHVELFRVDPERYTALVRALLDGDW